MFGIVLLSLLTSAALDTPKCETVNIAKILKRIEIADYIPSATPPPLSVIAELYLSAAKLTAACADSSHHYMDSRIGDLVEASVFAKFSAQAYLHDEHPRQACVGLSLAEEESGKAFALRPKADRIDFARIEALQRSQASVQRLFDSRCRG